jgi:hypothetical protein
MSEAAWTKASPVWAEDCNRWRGELLTGRFSHWCSDWDYLPVDETTYMEFDCCTCWDTDETMTYHALATAKLNATEARNAFWDGLAGLGE